MSQIPTSKPLTIEQVDRLIKQIAPLLTVNGGTFPRGVYYAPGKTIPSGHNIMGRMLDRYPLDGVRCEVLGLTLTIELTTARKGEQSEEDENHLCFSTSSYELFRMWFFEKIRSAGIEPKLPAPKCDKRSGPVKMDLCKAPFIPNRKPDHRR